MLQIEIRKLVLFLGLCGLCNFYIFAFELKGYASCLPFMIKVIVTNNGCEEYLPEENILFFFSKHEK